MKFFRFLIVCSLVFSCTNCFAQSFHTATAKSPAPGTMFVYPERIPLKNGGMLTARRGLMFVPLKRTKSKSDVIAVEFYKFPRSKSANPQTPPIFLLMGGPGFGGLEERLKRRGTFEREFQAQTEITDVVVVGQRGIGSSKPDTVIDQTTKSQPVDQPRDIKKAEMDFRIVLARERKYWIDQGVDLTGFNVIEAAADVKDIADGLGYGK